MNKVDYLKEDLRSTKKLLGDCFVILLGSLLMVGVLWLNRGPDFVGFSMALFACVASIGAVFAFLGLHRVYCIQKEIKDAQNSPQIDPEQP